MPPRGVTLPVEPLLRLRLHRHQPPFLSLTRRHPPPYPTDRSELPLFDAAARRFPPGTPGRELHPSPSSFFLVDASQQRGVQCRFGQRGIIAEGHFDAVRNFVAIVGGRKRYVLLPPEQCGHLRLITQGPSARHSGLDWTTPEGIAAVGDAAALEVVLEAGDVLYIPAFWLHFIVNLETNAQCNTRSGTPWSPAVDAMRACGFDMSETVTEASVEYADVGGAPPLHHAAAGALGGVDAPLPAFQAMAALREALGDAVAAV